METTAKVIAVSGKGGVGKTTLAAAMVRHLTECKPNARILAIDADPAVGLSTCLGVEVTLTLDEIRKQIIDNVEEGRTKEAMDLVEESRYRIFDALVEKNGFAFLASAARSGGLLLPHQCLSEGRYHDALPRV